MKFKNFEIRKLDNRPWFEVVKWQDEHYSGKPWCYVVAFIKWDPKEPCWEFESVGMRFIDDYEEGLCEFIKKFMECVNVIKEYEDEN